MILKVFLLIKNFFLTFFFLLFSMKVTKPYRIWLKYNNFRQKSKKISQKTPILAFLGQFFRFSREIFEFGIFHMAYPKTTDKNQALRKNPCPKKPLQLKLWFFISFFYQKRQFLAVFALKRAKLIFFFSKLTMLSVIEG